MARLLTAAVLALDLAWPRPVAPAPTPTPAPAPAPAPTPTPTPTTGAFADDYRYTPRFSLPAGYTYNSSTGLVGRAEVAWERVPGQGVSTVDPAAYTDVVRLTGTADVTANAAALQAAINAAAQKTTHTLILRTAHDWGTVTPPGRTAGGWVVVADQRVDPASPMPYPYAFGAVIPKSAAGTLPRHLSTSDAPVLPFANYARKYAFIGFECTFAAGWDTGAWNVGGRLANNRGFVNYNGEPSDLAAFPQSIAFKHGLVHGVLGKACKRGVYFNSAGVAYDGCNVYDIGEATQDAQSIYQAVGPGPYRYNACNLELGAGGENLLFGGGGTNGPTAAHMLGQVAILNCTFSNPTSWRALGGEGKPLIEFKCCDTALVQGCTLGPAHLRGLFANQFFAIAVKLTQDTPGQDWSTTRNITLRANRARDVYGFFAPSGDQSGGPAGRITNIECAHNVVEAAPTADGQARAYMIQFGGYSGDENVHVHHNTIFAPPNGDQYGGMVRDANDSYSAGSRRGLRLQGNAFQIHPNANPARWLCMTTDTVKNYLALVTAGGQATDVAIGGNAILHAGARQTDMLPGDVAYTQALATLLNADGSLPAGSLLATGDVDGGPQGADVRLVPA